MFGCNAEEPASSIPLEPLSKEEFRKFCYHLAAATRAFRDIGPPDDYLADFIGLGTRLIVSYECLLQSVWTEAND